jgi:pilus assembly protein Flp/PilA
MLRNVASRLRALLANSEGVTALEYGLIASAIVVAIATILPGMGQKLSATFSTISSAL